MSHGFGRIPSAPDARDFKMATAVRILERKTPRQPIVWHSDKVLNQGSTQHCVGFSWAGWGIATPVEDDWSDAMGHSVYKACKIVDGEPGDENGSTVRSGAKVMKTRGRIGTYFFAWSVDEAADYVARFGPVVLGTYWYDGMNAPRGPGYEMVPTGKIVGGHAYLWLGVDSKFARIRNSWGTGWGDHGDARISLRNLDYLFKKGGEACAATEKPLLGMGGK